MTHVANTQPSQVIVAPRVSLDDEPRPVEAPDRTIYSTQPRIAGASDGHRYYLKGPDVTMVVAEAVGYQLAHAVGLPVPAWAFARDPASDGFLFASRAVSVRSGLEVQWRTRQIENCHVLAECVPFDIWVANIDRNVGSFVLEPPTRAQRHRLALRRQNSAPAQLARPTLQW